MIHMNKHMNQIGILSFQIIEFKFASPISLSKLFSIPSLYCYCRYVKDRFEIWKALAKHRHPIAIQWQYLYCVNIKHRREIGESILGTDHVKAKYWKDLYLKTFNVRRE